MHTVLYYSERLKTNLFFSESQIHHDCDRFLASLYRLPWKHRIGVFHHPTFDDHSVPHSLRLCWKYATCTAESVQVFGVNSSTAGTVGLRASIETRAWVKAVWVKTVVWWTPKAQITWTLFFRCKHNALYTVLICTVYIYIIYCILLS
jgi:hypothetical protein